MPGETSLIHVSVSQFFDACRLGDPTDLTHLSVLKPADLSYGIHYACANGHLELAKQLHSFLPLPCPGAISPHVTMAAACREGHLHVAQWLAAVTPYSILTYGDIYYCMDLITCRIVRPKQTHVPIMHWLAQNLKADDFWNHDIQKMWRQCDELRWWYERWTRNRERFMTAVAPELMQRVPLKFND